MARKRLEKKLSAYERAGLLVLLILSVGSFAMMIVAFMMKEDTSIWTAVLSTTLAFVGGLLVGSNRRLNIP